MFVGTRPLTGNVFKEAGLAWIQNYEEGGTCRWCGKVDGTSSLSYCNVFLLYQLLLLIHWCTYSFIPLFCTKLQQFPGTEDTTANQSNLQPVFVLLTVQQRMELYKTQLCHMSHTNMGDGQVALGALGGALQQYLGWCCAFRK